MIGQALINFLFGSAIVSAGMYFFSIKGNEELRKSARFLFIMVFIGMLCVAAMLMTAIATHNFQYTYIWGHSNRDLPFALLLASFYSGQEGSFTLWTIFVSGIGVALLPYVQKHKYESETMGFYALILVFLLLMLVVKSPFALVWETYAADGIAQGFMPPDGRGLNPLLHNLWITIHPPILFIGFASMSVPFAFAMAALVKKDYHRWISISLPWTLFSTAVLGFGIMLGGLWAYETLGWGGYWAWDPVENSSLIPWIVAAALVHTMLTQKRTKGLVKTNLFLAAAAFVLVLYSTFLTRSGVLGDTSVHSFVDPGYFAYVLLLVFMSTFTAISIGLLLYRLKDMNNAQVDFKPTSREFTTSLGSAVLLGSAIIVFIGTSWPMIAELLGKPKVAIATTFYDNMHIPIAVLIGVLNGISLLQRWKFTSGKAFLSSLLPPAISAVIITIASVVLGVHDPLFVAMSFAAAFMISVNFQEGFRIISSKPSFGGAYVSHAGLAIFVFGVIATARYSSLEHLRLPEGESKTALGYTFTYVGKEQVEKNRGDIEKYHYKIKVQKEGESSFEVRPILFWSDFNKRQSAFLEPGIAQGMIKDIYVSPKSIETEGGEERILLTKEQPAQLPADSSIIIALERFDMSSATTVGEGNLKLGLILRLTTKDTSYSMPVYTIFKGQDGIAGKAEQQERESITIPETSYTIALAQIIANKENLSRSEAVLVWTDTNKPQQAAREVITVEASIKPLINLVWGGVLFMVLGFFVSIARRTKELRREDKQEEESLNTLSAQTPLPERTETSSEHTVE